MTNATQCTEDNADHCEDEDDPPIKWREIHAWFPYYPGILGKPEEELTIAQLRGVLFDVGEFVGQCDQVVVGDGGMEFHDSPEVAKLKAEVERLKGLLAEKGGTP